MPKSMSSNLNGLSSQVSIIMCCYNSAKRVPQTLEYLSRLTLPTAHAVELIVVDNASTDNTRQLAKETWSRLGSPFPMRIVTEASAGLSFARKKGVDEAEGELLLFCDDDNWLNANYLVEGTTLMGENASLGMLGGVGIPAFENIKPDWFDQVRVMYAVGDQHTDYPDVTTSKNYVYGAGAFVRKSAIVKIFEQNIRQVFSDRTANKLLSGGDNELGYLLVASGYKFHWSKELTFFHFIPQARLNYDYLRRMRKGYAFSYPMVSMYKSALTSQDVVFNRKVWMRDLIVSFKRLLRIRMRFIFPGKRNLRLLLEYWFYLGRLNSLIRYYRFYNRANKIIERNVSDLTP